MNATSVNYGGTYTFPSNSFTAPSNKHFTAWAWDGVNGTQYAPSATIGNITAAHTAYAIWAYDTYAIGYNANGGTGDGPAASFKTKTYGTALTLPNASQAGFTKTGHHLNYWRVGSAASTTTIALGGTYTTNSATTMYADWSPDTYTLTYTNGGVSGVEGSGPAARFKTKTYGTDLTLPTASQAGYTRSYYVLGGWQVQLNATSTVIDAGGAYTYNEAATLIPS